MNRYETEVVIITHVLEMDTDKKKSGAIDAKISRGCILVKKRGEIKKRKKVDLMCLIVL